MSHRGKKKAALCKTRNGLEWNGMDGIGMERSGTVWNGLEWIQMEWNGTMS